MKRKEVFVLIVTMLAFSGFAFAEGPPSLWEMAKTIQSKEFVDLTHTFHPGIPRWPGFDNEQRVTTYYYDEAVGTKGHGFFAQRYCIPGQWGTHVNPPAHFARGKRFLDEISVKEMILPLVVLDISKQAEKNPDYQITMEDVRTWEKKYGPVPEASFVAMRTDWSKRWPNAEKMRNADAKDVAHYPGWSKEVLTYLYEERHITASGHDTTNADSGISTSRGDYSLEAYVLSHDRYLIDLLTNLDKVPEYGAIAVVTFPKPKRGSGFPARVFAILP
jgi:kynurenine formamidase